MDRIFLSEMKIETTVGIWEWEKRIKQQVIIDIEMSADIKKAAATDQIEDTLNYKAVAKSVRKLVEESSFQLVETMAEKISELVIGEHNVSCCLLYTSPSPRDGLLSRMPSSA